MERFLNSAATSPSDLVGTSVATLESLDIITSECQMTSSTHPPLVCRQIATDRHCRYRADEHRLRWAKHHKAPLSVGFSTRSTRMQSIVSGLQQFCDIRLHGHGPALGLP